MRRIDEGVSLIATGFPPAVLQRSVLAGSGPRGRARMRQVTGPDLMLDLLARVVERGWAPYFYGGAEGVPEMLANHLGLRFPGLKVVAPFVRSGRQRSWAPYPARHPASARSCGHDTP
ncbi:WecB/TagA/CpsF family glycosyltransferase [Streptodolium elevatio]